MRGDPLTQTEPERALSLTHVPIFFSFFTWGFGTGAQHLVRPLFAYALTENVFLVAVVIAMNAIPRIFTAPVTGYLTDRIGRKPLALFGAALRGVTNVGQFMSGDFATFLALEFIGQIGVSMWNTSSNVLLSDVTQTTNRGRVLALRQMSTRMGFVAGPLIGGLVAAVFGLQSVFLVNGVSKVVIVLVVLFMVSETRPERVTGESATPVPQKGDGRAAVLAVMRTRSFAALAITLVGFSMAQTAILQALLPIYASTKLGADESSVGALVSVAAVVAFLLAYPNGIVSDRFGRKVSMVPGLLLLSAASMLLTISDTYLLVLIAVAIQGSGEGLAMGTAHTYAMDLAPKDHRGSFLGVTMMFQALGAFAGPMFIGALYHGFSPAFAFATLAVWLAVASLAMGLFAKETAGPRAIDRASIP